MRAEAGRLITTIIGTGIAVVTILGIEKTTDYRQTTVECAGVTVVTEFLFVTTGEGAGITQVLCTRILVIAETDVTAPGIDQAIIHRTHVAVVTGVGQIDATIFNVTIPIYRTEIIINTRVRWIATHTVAFVA